MGIVFGILRVCGLCRVDPKDDEEGLAHSHHGGVAVGGADDTTGEFKPTCSRARSRTSASSLMRSRHS